MRTKTRITVVLNDEYVARLPKNKLLAANQICNDYLDGKLKETAYDIIYTLEILLEDEGEARDSDFPLKGPWGIIGIARLLLGENAVAPSRRIKMIHRRVKALMTRQAIIDPTSINPLLVSLSKEEKQQIDDLLSEVRNIIRASTVISEDHKRRLLRVVNNLQAELDKEYSDFRVFLDGLVEASEAVGEAGDNIKPVFDRIKTLFGIADKARKLQDRLGAPGETERLPAPPKQLAPPDDTNR